MIGIINAIKYQLSITKNWHKYGINIDYRKNKLSDCIVALSLVSGKNLFLLLVIKYTEALQQISKSKLFFRLKMGDHPAMIVPLLSISM